MGLGINVKDSSALKHVALDSIIEGNGCNTPKLAVGMGPVSHVGKRQRLGSMSSFGVVVTAVTALLLATTPIAAQTKGASLDGKQHHTEAPAELKQVTPGTDFVWSPKASADVKADFRAPADAQWFKLDLKPEQVVVSRFDADNGRLAGKVHITVPWPAEAPRDIDNVELFVFAKDDKVDFRLEGDTLHLNYVSEMGLREGLQNNSGVFQLHMKDGFSNHLLSFDSDKLTFDDRQITLEQLRDRIPTLERMIEVYTEHERDRVPGRYDNYGMRSSDQTIRELKLVRQQISDITSGKATHRSVY